MQNLNVIIMVLQKRFKMNYIVYYKRVNDKIEYDFDRFKHCTRHQIYKYMARLFEFTKDIKDLRYEIWKADDVCYKTVGAVPIESGGIDSILAQYGEKICVK